MTLKRIRLCARVCGPTQPKFPADSALGELRIGRAPGGRPGTSRKSLVKGLAKELEIDEPYLEKRAAVVRKNLG